MVFQKEGGKESILNRANLIEANLIKAYRRFAYLEIGCNCKVVQGVIRHEVGLNQIVKTFEKSLNAYCFRKTAQEFMMLTISGSSL